MKHTQIALRFGQFCQDFFADEGNLYKLFHIDFKPLD